MALSTVKDIILKAATDAEFREIFFKDTNSVLSRYNLTEEEKQCLRELTSDSSLEKAVMTIQTKAVCSPNDIRY